MAVFAGSVPRATRVQCGAFPEALIMPDQLLVLSQCAENWLVIYTEVGTNKDS